MGMITHTHSHRHHTKTKAKGRRREQAAGEYRKKHPGRKHAKRDAFGRYA
jgi:hypothetical protein